MATPIVLVAVAVALAAAQFPRGGRGGGGFYGGPVPYATLDDFDGSFQFCRIATNFAADGDGGRWYVDFPRADENPDFGDAFEREGDNHEYFLEFSVPGYTIGVNALLYAMTH